MSVLLDKKKSIIQSALDLIQEHGFHGCPVSMVAKNAGVAAGTIYTYFENKDDLIIGIYEHVVEEIKKYVSERDDLSLPFKERFYNYWKNLTNFYELNPSIHGFYDQFLNSPYNSDDLQSNPNVWHEFANAFFEDGIQQGDIKQLNPVVLSILVNTNVNSIVRIKQNFKKKLEKNNMELNEISHLIWDGIKAD
ncbi:TetR family transcriptional regulator [Algoriphagus ratkowskyi]|uniref:TetR family transcriptional regulator n=1 Tax=Algoriphagus ratkowskyi TaxID=57028 RepID=A0A2W7QYW7_9BACT|nr:TetR/AcrR family transcriptional regulator [Algoriphagus ratkowskyi]PZX53121.1 TetR family transcriptional regulator [Algoriphagus ratkowskyi]TXD76399.1 TetR/AcrR family transcriptional regulator [Algoriphagus ratkowskyi]